VLRAGRNLRCAALQDVVHGVRRSLQSQYGHYKPDLGAAQVVRGSIHAALYYLLAVGCWRAAAPTSRGRVVRMRSRYRPRDPQALVIANAARGLRFLGSPEANSRLARCKFTWQTAPSPPPRRYVAYGRRSDREGGMLAAAAQAFLNAPPMMKDEASAAVMPMTRRRRHSPGRPNSPEALAVHF